jgi:hypothetical protein
MSKNWIFNSIFGSDEPVPARPVPVPYVDTRQILTNGKKRTSGLEKQLERCSREESIKSIFGSEMLDEMQNSELEEPSFNTYRQDPLLELVPEHVSDPRKIKCECPCRMCQSGSGCFNCLATPRCEFSHLTILDGILPVNPETETKLRQAARDRQRKRIASKRTEQPFKVERQGNLRKSFFSWGEAWEIVLV